MQDENWAKATVPYGDYSGDAAADHWIVNGKGFSAIPGLDLDRYQVMGISFNSTEHSSWVHLALLDRQEYGEKSVSELVREHGFVPITDMQLHDFTIDSFLKLVMNQAEFTLTHRWLEGHTMNVVDRTDLPLQQ